MNQDDEKKKEAVSNDGWVDIKEQLPNKDGIYLVLCNERYLPKFNVVKYTSCTRYFNSYHDHITHWRPLPKSPNDVKLETLVKKVIAWADESNIIKSSTNEQGLKLMAKHGELCDSIAKKDIEGIKKGIGNVAVSAIIIGVQQDSPFSIEHYARNEHEHYPIDGDYILGYVKEILGCELRSFIKKLSCSEWILCCLSEVALVFGLTLIDCIQHVFDELRGCAMTNNQSVKLLTLQEPKLLTLQEALEAMQNNKTVEVWTETDNTWQVFTAQRFTPEALLADEVKFRLAQITGKKTLADLKYTEIENEGVMITALNSDGKTIFIHRLTARELDPDYMTTDRLYDMLERRLKKSGVKDYECLEDFVIDFVLTKVRV